MLTERQRARIRELYSLDPKRWNITALSVQYKVTRQAIGFILFPERRQRNNELRRKRNDSNTR